MYEYSAMFDLNQAHCKYSMIFYLYANIKIYEIIEIYMIYYCCVEDIDMALTKTSKTAYTSNIKLNDRLCLFTLIFGKCKKVNGKTS